MKEYRIIQHCWAEGGTILIQVEGLLWWHTIWQRDYAAGEGEYARQCAEELVAHLMERI